MMGYQTARQERRVYTAINLEDRVRPNHLLRKVAQVVDFDFVYADVAATYGSRGNVSVPPPVLLKLMLLLVLYKVRSERELMATVPERLDWLWFLGYDLNTPIPHHSVLSKARKRWGAEVFKRFFTRIVWQCVEAGLVDGQKIFLDSSLVQADASNNSVVDTQSLGAQLNPRYQAWQQQRQETPAPTPEAGPKGTVNTRYLSTTDPDAAIVRRGKPKLLYQTHRAVDGRSEVITATRVTAGDVNEAHLLVPLWEDHRTTTKRTAVTVVADNKYGTIENYLACCDRGVAAHIPDLKQAADKRAVTRKIFPDTRFIYDAASDTYRCPAGQRLRRKSLHLNRQSIDYAAPKQVCAACPLRSQCTQNKMGRTIKRHLRQEDLERMRERSRSSPARRDIRLRQHLMERSFARGVRYGFDRARWRGLWREEIQEYVTAAIQNIELLIRYGSTPRKAPAVVAQRGRALPNPLHVRSHGSLTPLMHKLLVMALRRTGVCASTSVHGEMTQRRQSPPWPGAAYTSRHGLTSNIKGSRDRPQ